MLFFMAFWIGCTSLDNSAEFAIIKKKLDIWIGKKQDQLVMTWGIPGKTYSFENKNSSIEYSSKSMKLNNSGGGFSMEKSNYQAPNYITLETLECKITWMISEKKILLYYTIDGNLGECNSIIKEYK